MDFKKYRLNQRVVTDLRKRSSMGLPFYVLVALAVSLNDDYYLRHPGLSIGFLAAIIAVCGLRGVHVVLLPRLKPSWEKFSTSFFLVSVALTALVWGVGFAVFMVQDGEYQAKLLMVMCTTGLCAGGVVAFIPERRLSLVFNLLMLVPCALTLWFMDMDRFLAGLLLLFSVYMILVAFRGNTEYWDALENEFLLAQRTRDLEKISRVDVLTGLFNRRHFDEILQYQWNLSLREKEPLTLVIADIDHFKRINDTHGHLAGDAFLKGTAMLLESVFKRETDIVARFGGEEFIVLLGKTGTESARVMAEEYRTAMASFSLPYRDVLLKATISLGLATCVPDLSRTPTLLIGEADQALYRAKREGRNRVRVFSKPA